MISYFDTSALVKRYALETGSQAVYEAIAASRLAGTVLITRAEVAAAFAKAIRTATLTTDEAVLCLSRFREDWPRLVRLPVSEATVARAEQQAWQSGLRGYDSVHLAAALLWQEALGVAVTVVTYDRALWIAAAQAGLANYPADLITATSS